MLSRGQPNNVLCIALPGTGVLNNIVTRLGLCVCIFASVTGCVLCASPIEDFNPKTDATGLNSIVSDIFTDSPGGEASPLRSDERLAGFTPLYMFSTNIRSPAYFEQLNWRFFLSKDGGKDSWKASPVWSGLSPLEEMLLIPVPAYDGSTNIVAAIETLLGQETLERYCIQDTTLEHRPENPAASVPKGSILSLVFGVIILVIAGLNIRY